MTGPFAKIDESLLAKSQSSPTVIVVPSGSLAPGSYIFEINATDYINSLTGTTQFTLTILAQNLTLQLPGYYLTVSVNSEVSVTCDKCTDPDNLSGFIVYK